MQLPSFPADLLLYIFQFTDIKTFVTCLRLNRSSYKQLFSHNFIYTYLKQNLSLQYHPIYQSITSIKECCLLINEEILRRQLLLLYCYSVVLDRIVPLYFTEYNGRNEDRKFELEEKYKLDSPLVFIDRNNFGLMISFSQNYQTFQILEFNPRYGISGHYHKDFISNYSYKDFYTALKSLFITNPRLWILQDHRQYPGWEYLKERNELKKQ